jgi:hypothetical protein
MAKSQFFLALTLLGVGAYAWYTNAKMTRMQRDVLAIRERAVADSKRSPSQTGTILTERYIEKVRAGTALPQQGQESSVAGPVLPQPSEFDPVEMRRRADENAEHLQQATFAEAKDPAWDSQAEAEIRKLDDMFPGSSVRTTECRTTMCYIDVVHDDMAAFSNWSMRAALEPSEAFASRLVIRFAEPDGKVSSKVFLARKGKELPAID